MVCFAVVYYEIWTKSPPFTEEFQPFQSRMIRRKDLICNVCNAKVWYVEWKSIRLYAMVGIRFLYYAMNFTAMLCYGVCCKRYDWTDCK